RAIETSGAKRETSWKLLGARQKKRSFREREAAGPRARSSASCRAAIADPDQATSGSESPMGLRPRSQCRRRDSTARSRSRQAATPNDHKDLERSLASGLSRRGSRPLRIFNAEPVRTAQREESGSITRKLSPLPATWAASLRRPSAPTRWEAEAV